MALSKGFEIATLGSGLDVDQTNGDVLTIDMTTSVISEGSNLYFTDERVDDRVSSLLVAGSNVGLTYDDTAGTLTLSLLPTGGFNLSENDTTDLAEDPAATGATGTAYYTDSRVQTYLSGGTATTMTTTGDVTVGGNLIVNGTETTLNTTTLTVDDLNITVASGAADAATANGAGLTVDGASATLIYGSTDDQWQLNKQTKAPGFIDTTLGNTGNIMVVGANKELDDTSVLFLDSANGRIGLGVTDPAVLFEIGSTAATVRVQQNNTAATGANLEFYKSRGNRVTPTAVATNDEIFKIKGLARGATQFVDSVNLIANATDTVGNATYDIQTRVSSSLASRLKVLGTGAVQFNGAYKFPTADGTANQVLATDASGTLTFETLDATIDWNVSDNYAYKTITDGVTDAIASANNDTFKVRGGDQIEVTVANNDATHGDNLLIGHAASGITAGSFGSATLIPVVTVDTEGHVTGVTTTAITTSWTATDGVTTQTINNGDAVLFNSGTDMSVTVSATDQVTIAHDVTGANTTISTAANTFVDAITVSAQGHVTSAGTGTVDFNVADNYAYKTFTDGATSSIAGSNTDTFTITGGDQVSATVGTDTVTLGHDDSGVAAGSTGSSTLIPAITVDAQGHVTAISSNAVSTSWTISDSTTTQAINNGNTLIVADGADINAVVSATDTLTINNTSTLDTVTGRGDTTTNDINVGAVFTGDSTGANSISDGGVSIGAGNDFNLYHYLGTNYIRATGQIIMNAPDDFRIRNGASDWFKVEGSNGYVGIGNSAPSNPLHVTSTATGGTGIPLLIEGRENPMRGVKYNAGVDGATLFLEHSRSNTLGTAAALNDNDEVGMLSWRAYNSSNAINGAADIQVLVDGTTGTHTPTEMKLRTQSATGTSYEIVMRANGNVGIGSSAPDKLLVVQGVDAEIVINDTDTTDTPRLRFRESGSTSGTIHTDASEMIFSSGATESMRIASTGNVGIGTASPSTLLHIASNGSPQFRIQDNDQTNDWTTIGHNNGLTSISSRKDAASGSIAFRGINSNAEFMRIEASGNVGIGTATPDEKLHVQGNIVVEAAGHAAGVYVMEKTIASSASQDIFTIANTNGAQVFQVMFNCSSTGYSVAKMFNVVHALGAGPVTNKTVDTGAYNTTEDFSVAFTDVTNTGVKCAITNNGTLSGTITITLILGGSPQAVTLTKH